MGIGFTLAFLDTTVIVSAIYGSSFVRYTATNHQFVALSINLVFTDGIEKNIKIHLLLSFVFNRIISLQCSFMNIVIGLPVFGK